MIRPGLASTSPVTASERRRIKPSGPPRDTRASSRSREAPPLRSPGSPYARTLQKAETEKELKKKNQIHFFTLYAQFLVYFVFEIYVEINKEYQGVGFQARRR